MRRPLLIKQIWSLAGEVVNCRVVAQVAHDVNVTNVMNAVST